MTVSSLSLSSPVVTDLAESRTLREVRRCSVDVVAVGDGGSRCAPSSRGRRWRGRRSSAPLFVVVVWADPARPPKQHLAHLMYNFLYWSSSPGHCVRVFFLRLLPSSPCIVARVRRLVQHHLLVLLYSVEVYMLFRQKVHGGCAFIVHMVVVLSLVK